MDDQTITFVILAVAVVVFILDRVPVALAAVGVALALWATDVLDLNQALAGFGDPAVLFIASLFVVSEALDASGVTAWAGQQLVDNAGGSRSRVLILTMLLSAALTALITPNGSVAALVPVVVVTAVRIGASPSQLLLPLAFAAHAGSLLLLTASPVNVIVSETAADAGVGSIGFFAFALTGVPLLIGTVVIVALVGARLVPDRVPRVLPVDFSTHARTLAAQYGLADPDRLLTREYGLAEIVIPPRSELVGETTFPGMVTERGDLVVAAVRRHDIDQAGDTVLAVGDTLLLRGDWGALAAGLDDLDVLVVDPPDQVRRQAVPLGPGAKRAIAILAGMVVLLATGAVPPAVAGLLAAGAIVVTGVLTIEQAYRGIGWTTVILVAGMIPLSTAMTTTGAAESLADRLVDVAGGHGPRLLLLAIVLLVFALGQLISNMATALIVLPIAVSAAGELHVSPKPLLIAVAVAAAASFLTPVATPANLMVMEPGGYRFGDYWKLGLPLLALYGVVAVVLVPLIWSF